MRRRRFNSVFTPSRDFTCCYYMSCSAQGVELLRYFIVSSIMYYHDDVQIQPVSVSKHSGSSSESIQTLAAACAVVSSENIRDSWQRWYIVWIQSWFSLTINVHCCIICLADVSKSWRSSQSCQVRCAQKLAIQMPLPLQSILNDELIRAFKRARNICISMGAVFT